MTWVAVAIAGSAVIGAGASIYGSKQAADASVAGSKQALAEQQRQYNIALQLLEPSRALGYGAQSDLATLYGYALPAYPTPGANNAGMPITVKANQGGGVLSNMPNPSPLAGLGHNPLDMFGGGKPDRYGGTIDPTSGTVDVKGAGAKKDDIMTHYLRTGEWIGGDGKRLNTLRQQVDRLRAAGYQYNAPGAAGEAGAPPPAAGVTGQPSMERFFTSPDYEFRRSEGLRGIENSAAARGGALSGNAIRGATEFSSNLASGEFGNYVSRLMSIAGIGTGATTQAINTGQNTSNNVSNLYSDMGNARGSGYLTAAAGVNNAIQGGLQNWMFNRYLQGGGGSSPSYSTTGPWADGYVFPGKP